MNAKKVKRKTKAAPKKAARRKTSKRPAKKTVKHADWLLVELGTEELPPKALSRLSKAFGKHFVDGLSQAMLTSEASAEYSLYATPRRLAVLVPEVKLRQQDQLVERRGPALQAAFDDKGAPTQAAMGFARSCGVAPEKLQRLENDKGSWLVFRKKQKGQPAARLIPEILEEALKKLPIPKRMRWSDLQSEFVRPVHWLVLMHGKNVIKTSLLEAKAGQLTYGHRFHYPKPIKIGSPTRYAELLQKRGYVIPGFDERREQIRKQVEKLAERHQGVAVIGEELLDEVTGLVEWPQPILGEFEKDFLKVPPEALITTMRDNQKYFHVTNKRGRLLPYFITVSNIKSRRPQKIREGNERVIRARLADARFFWETDRKIKLEQRVERLRDVVFHVKLGSVHDKLQRVRGLAGFIAGQLDADATLAERAALLSKADLTTGMVYEFPELQGIMGRYYAAHDGEAPQVVSAMEEQYFPRFAGDRLPSDSIGQALSIAEKLDTLIGIFGVGEIPSGDKDPFALRRAAVGVLRIMIEGRLGLDLCRLLKEALKQYELKFEPGGVVDDVYRFMMDRLRAYYQDAGLRPDVIESVMSCSPTRPYDFDQRVRAVRAFRKLPQAESLAAANKRIRNILRQAGEFNREAVDDAALLREAAEVRLLQQLQEMEQRVQPLFASGDYSAALSKLAGLREAVDAFFDDVMVMVDDQALREARLRLLNRLSELFLQVADVSKLQG